LSLNIKYDFYKYPITKANTQKIAFKGIYPIPQKAYLFPRVNKRLHKETIFLLIWSLNAVFVLPFVLIATISHLFPALEITTICPF